ASGTASPGPDPSSARPPQPPRVRAIAGCRRVFACPAGRGRLCWQLSRPTLLPVGETAMDRSRRRLTGRSLHGPQRWAYRPRLETLEDRALFSTCVVNSLGDTGAGRRSFGDLRYCINRANTLPGPDTIDFTVTGTIVLNGALPDLRTEITIDGPGADVLTIDAAKKARVLTVTSGADVSLNGLALANGLVRISGPGSYYADGGGIYNAGKLLIRDSVVKANKVDAVPGVWARGGGIYNAGSLTVSYTTLAENVVDAGVLYQSSDGGLGGALYNAVGANATILNSTLANNGAVVFGYAA